MEYVWLTVTGLVAGILGGLLGIGGSVVMIPAMTLIFAGRGTNIHQYQAAAMIINFVLMVPAVWRHHRAGAVYWRVWRGVGPAALAGIIAGVLLSRTGLFTGGNERYLRMVFGLFLLYVAGDNLRKLLGRRKTEGLSREAAGRIATWKKLAVGAPMGVVAGLLGIGGGSLAVPALQVGLRLGLRNAIATSSATILSIAWLGAILKNAALGDDGTVARSLVLAGVLAPTAILGAALGGHLTHRLDLRIVRAVFIALMLAAAWKMLS